MTTLTISIVTYVIDEAVFRTALERLIEAILYGENQGTFSDTKVIIVDNGANDQDLKASLKLLRDREVTAILHSTESNLGYGAAHNIAIENHPADIHVILNPDVYQREKNLHLSAVLLKQEKDIALVCPRGVDANNQPAYLAKRYPSVLLLAVRAIGLQSLVPEKASLYEYRDRAHQELHDIELASGCCMIVNGDKLRMINGFDEHYFLYFEDYDLSLRLAKLGRLVSTRSVQITHFGGDAARKGLQHWRLFIVSGLRFFRTHGWKIV